MYKYKHTQTNSKLTDIKKIYNKTKKTAAYKKIKPTKTNYTLPMDEINNMKGIHVMAVVRPLLIYIFKRTSWNNNVP